MIISVTKTAFAQRLTADEMLEKSKCRTFDCFNDFILPKGFSFLNSGDTLIGNNVNCKTYAYSSDKEDLNSTKEISTKNVAAIIFNSNNKVSIFYRTASKDYYLKLLNEFKSKGFYSYRTIVEKANSQRIHVYYKCKNDTTKSIDVTSTALELGEIKYTLYSFALSNDEFK